MINEDLKLNLNDISRIELIDDSGRIYVNRDVFNVTFTLQDDGKTLKVSIITKE